MFTFDDLDNIIHLMPNIFHCDGKEEVERRGQGLFVSKSYIAKIGGTIEAQNLTNGVVFIIRLPRVKKPKATA